MCSSWNCPTTSAIRSTHILAKIRWKSPRDRVGGGFRSLLLDNFPRRETPAFPSICTTAIFQFTSPRRDELGKSTIMSPQGDEQLCRPFLCFVPYFNSRLRKETNYSIYTFLLILLLFQLTSPQGDEHKAVSLFISLLLFQITSPQGDELQILVLGTYSSYFNSHPSKETNLYSSVVFHLISSFQLASPQGDERKT